MQQTEEGRYNENQKKILMSILNWLLHVSVRTRAFYDNNQQYLSSAGAKEYNYVHVKLIRKKNKDEKYEKNEINEDKQGDMIKILNDAMMAENFTGQNDKGEIYFMDE